MRPAGRSQSRSAAVALADTHLARLSQGPEQNVPGGGLQCQGLCVWPAPTPQPGAPARPQQTSGNWTSLSGVTLMINRDIPNLKESQQCRPGFRLPAALGKAGEQAGPGVQASPAVAPRVLRRSSQCLPWASRGWGIPDTPPPQTMWRQPRGLRLSHSGRRAVSIPCPLPSGSLTAGRGRVGPPELCLREGWAGTVSPPHPWMPGDRSQLSLGWAQRLEALQRRSQS